MPDSGPGQTADQQLVYKKTNNERNEISLRILEKWILANCIPTLLKGYCYDKLIQTIDLLFDIRHSYLSAVAETSSKLNQQQGG